MKATLKIKKVFVEADEFDTDTRKSLNLGHTFAHAIESSSDFRIPHGISVIVGCALAFHFAIDHGMLEPTCFLQHIDLIDKLLLASSEYCISYNIDSALLKSALISDKKMFSLIVFC